MIFRTRSLLVDFTCWNPNYFIKSNFSVHWKKCNPAMCPCVFYVSLLPIAHLKLTQQTVNCGIFHCPALLFSRHLTRPISGCYPMNISGQADCVTCSLACNFRMLVGNVSPVPMFTRISWIYPGVFVSDSSEVQKPVIEPRRETPHIFGYHTKHE